MQKKHMNKALSVILCNLLVVAMALCTVGCTGGAKGDIIQESNEAVTVIQDGDILGEGTVSFQFTVIDADGKAVSCEIHTNEQTVGDALTALGVLQGEAGPYGLYVKTVNGITVDYNKDGKYWAFYVNDEYGMSGVDVTDIEAGASYAFKVE